MFLSPPWASSSVESRLKRANKHPWPAEFGEHGQRTLPRADTQEAGHVLLEDFVKMTVASLQFWLPKLVIEVRRSDRKHYPPDSLYAICAGLLKFNDRADVQIFSNSHVLGVRWMLKSRLRSLRKYQKNKAEVIAVDQEDLLWSKGLLGDSTPNVLLEHRKLCFKPSQIESLPYLVYTEFVSKTNQGGLQHRKKEPKKLFTIPMCTAQSAV